MERIVPEAAERLFLLNANPEEVYRYLCKHTQSQSMFDQTLPDEIQKDLLARNEPIIDLALAQFGDCKEVINEILAKDNRDLRIAVLANPNRLQPFELTGLLPDEVSETSAGTLENARGCFKGPTVWRKP